MKKDFQHSDSGTDEELKNLWQTPPFVRAWVMNQYLIGFDTAADADNCLVPNFWCEEDSALEKMWYPLSDPNAWYWCNPPYDDIDPWVQKAVQSMVMGGRVLMLVPCDLTTDWAGMSINMSTMINHLTGLRINFSDPMAPKTGKERSQNNKGSVLYEFDGHCFEYSGQKRTTYLNCREIKRVGNLLLKSVSDDLCRLRTPFAELIQPVRPNL